MFTRTPCRLMFAALLTFSFAPAPVTVDVGAATLIAQHHTIETEAPDAGSGRALDVLFYLGCGLAIFGAVAASPVLSADDAATFLGANVRTLERWRNKGEGPVFVKIGRRVAYRLDDLEAYLQQQRRASTTATSAPISPAA